MKSLRILAAIAAAACLWACNEKDDPTTPDPGKKDDPKETPSISVSPSSVPFEAEGGTLRVAVTTNVDSYTVSGNPDWLTYQINGKEISLTAAQNTVAEARNCTLTVTADTATASIEVSQKACSPYPGYIILQSATLEYGGTMLYQVMKPTEEDYGGWGTLSLADEDGNKLILWIYTDLFTSAEEVELTTGTYVKGDDNYLGLSLCAKKLTYMPGVYVPGSDGDDGYTVGCYYTDVATEQETALITGTIQVSEENGTYTIKVDMSDAGSKAYKYIFIGDVTVDTTGATYPSNGERIDVVNTVFGAVCYYKGITELGTSGFALQLYSGTPENFATTNFDFYMPAVPFSEDIDISGIYATPGEGEEGEEPAAPHSAGTLDPGVLYDFGAFKFASGTFIMFDQTYTDFVVGDAYDSLMITKAEDGTYTINMAAIMSTEGDMFLFMGIQGLQIQFIDGTQGGGED